MRAQYLVRDNQGDVVLYGVTLTEASHYIETNIKEAPFEVHEIAEDSLFEMNQYLH